MPAATAFLAALCAVLLLACAAYASSAAPPAVSFTTNGSAPRSYPSLECGGLLGVCMSAPIEKARQLLGIEDTRYGLAHNGISSTWNLDRPSGTEVIADSDRVGSINFLLARVQSPALLARTRIALPGHLRIGGSTMGDVLRRFGTPVKKSKDYAETNVVYSYKYWAGPEGSYLISFDVITTIGSRTDPKGFNARLNATRVNQYVACSTPGCGA